ncbi:BMC domain-containing protein [Paraglaciecola arctica]|uniref:Carbon dioxide-concentrating mechanism protein CcmK n=1 Tax=Paraglaciecola arctica BSs20135 TaxID=493475 RepID=K6YE75_9ALTE|nr:BMC domain-containing protein [Paraglaciecola arctica]GAC22261.1 carbon dioxide-concentrating mechanism protein CcmK [Paraglaciecola arctica BSs20135]
MEASLGIIETKGLIASIEAADAMLKSAYVKLLQRSQPGAGLTLILCIGELGDCQVAVAAGAAAAKRVGILYCEHIIARPSEDLDEWLAQTGYTSSFNKSISGLI